MEVDRGIEVGRAPGEYRSRQSAITSGWLRDAGLVDCERRGTWVWYRARRDALNAVGGLVARPGLVTHTRSGTQLWLGEVVATAGLVLVIVSLARSGRSGQTPWAVGAYIGAA